MACVKLIRHGREVDIFPCSYQGLWYVGYLLSHTTEAMGMIPSAADAMVEALGSNYADRAYFRPHHCD